MEICRRIFLVFPELSPKGMKFCKCRISKSIIARNLKLVMLIHGQETRDYSASFPFLNWRPPLRLIDQLAIYF